SQVESLEPEQRNRLHALAGWFAKTGVDDDECILRLLADAVHRLSGIRDLHAYYSRNGPARTTIEGHYRADTQDHDSKRRKAGDWEWLRRFKAQQVPA